VPRIKTPKSEFIADISYHEILEELTVHIRPASAWNPRRTEKRLVYGRVPKQVYLEFKKAESKGGFFNHHIRLVYPFLGELEGE
jgi:hypothetical protein